MPQVDGVEEKEGGEEEDDEEEEVVTAGPSFLDNLNPDSLKQCKAFVEPSLKDAKWDAAKAGDKFQFQRCGFFSVDKDSTPGKLVFNRVVGLKEAADKK